ncbi:MAG TPA: AAC(3) family N-acetyltransferase [Chloroflexota bacterium]|nr:AAC(3) family N-acetyltransferase [Chloroflexota bacterium]
MTRADVAAGLGRLGIAAGETVFFHSSLRSLGHVDGGADAVVDGVADAVGPLGTVAVPTFTLLGRVGPFGSWYDHEQSPSTVGAITETLRRRPGAIRSVHPIHSVAALGRRATALTAGHLLAHGRVSPWCDAAFAWGSPFDLLARWNAWYVLLGVTYNVQTIMHYVEAIVADAVVQRAPPAARGAVVAGIRRWGTPGVWASLDRVRLGEAIQARGAYAVTGIGAATVRAAPFQTVLGHSLDVVLGDPAAWLNPPFREWMGAPPAPRAVLAAYTAPEGVPPLDPPGGGAGVSCAGNVALP